MVHIGDSCWHEMVKVDIAMHFCCKKRIRDATIKKGLMITL